MELTYPPILSRVIANCSQYRANGTILPKPFFWPSLFALTILFYPTLCLPQEANETFLCATEETTGFLFTDETWQTVNLPLQDNFLIRPIGDDEEKFLVNGQDYTHGLFQLGSDTLSMRCTFDQFFRCEGLGQLFFDLNTGRFIRTRTWGYWAGNDSEADYPHISRGLCSRI